jgi:hypothetical protein
MVFETIIDTSFDLIPRWMTTVSCQSKQSEAPVTGNIVGFRDWTVRFCHVYGRLFARIDNGNHHFSDLHLQ